MDLSVFLKETAQKYAFLIFKNSLQLFVVLGESFCAVLTEEELLISCWYLRDFMKSLTFL